MNTNLAIGILFASAIIPGSEQYSWFRSESKWVRTVKNGDIKAAHNVDCEALGPAGMRECLKVDKQDETLAVVIKQCPQLLPAGQAFDHYSYELYISNLPHSFRALISNGRCTQISREMMQHLLASMVDNNSVEFVRSVVKQCVVNPDDWHSFIHRAEIRRRTEILLILRDQGGFVGGPEGFTSSSWSSTHNTNKATHNYPAYNSMPSQQNFQDFNGSQELKQQNQVPISNYNTQSQNVGLRNSNQQVYYTGGTYYANNANPTTSGAYDIPRDASAITAGSRPPNAGIQNSVPVRPGYMSGSYRGHLIKVSPETVSANLIIIAQLSPNKALRFGLLGEGCVGLTATHFQQPGVSPAVVGSLSLNCFQKMPPEAFAGLTAQMVDSIKWWPFVTRDQIKFVQPGDPFRAIPFDQLGLGRQKSADDKIHPCWTITRAQIQSIKKTSAIYKEYTKRCIRSFSNHPQLSFLLMGLPTLLIAIFTLI